MCPLSPESQLHSELHQKKCGQQGEGGDPAPLLCAGESSLGVLCPNVESSVQERHGPVGACTEKGHKNDPRAGTPLLQGQESWAGDEKTLVVLRAAFQYLKGSDRRKGTDSLAGLL